MRFCLLSLQLEFRPRILFPPPSTRPCSCLSLPQTKLHTHQRVVSKTPGVEITGSLLKSSRRAIWPTSVVHNLGGSLELSRELQKAPMLGLQALSLWLIQPEWGHEHGSSYKAPCTLSSWVQDRESLVRAFFQDSNNANQISFEKWNGEKAYKKMTQLGREIWGDPPFREHV